MIDNSILGNNTITINKPSINGKHKHKKVTAIN